MSRVENGRASYRNRWVRTPRFEVERKAGEALSGGFARVHLSHRAPAPAQVS